MSPSDRPTHRPTPRAPADSGAPGNAQASASAAPHPGGRRGWGLMTAVAGFTAAFGALTVAAPGPTRAAFGWTMFGEPGRIASWGAEAAAYATLLHGVLGAVMLGWGLLMALLCRAVAQARIEPAWGWRAIALSVGVWFVVDQAHSVALGAWPNVALNSGFGLLFGLALWRARGRAGLASVGR
jgi:hypothetical protein